MSGANSKSFWNDAARKNAAWHVATGFQSESPEFFESGRREVEEYLDRCGVTLDSIDTVLEIGCGVGRMTRRLAELAGSVIAVDVSGEMLARASLNLADLSTIHFLEVSGNGDLPLQDAAVNAVFSYITMQHVPSVTAQSRYFDEALRVLAPGGWALIQYRRPGAIPRILDWIGHVWHGVHGRRTFNRAWRGVRISERALLSRRTATITVSILPYSRRHIWVLARKS